MDDDSPPPATSREVSMTIGRTARAGARPKGAFRRFPLLWQMVLLALVGHVAFIGATSMGSLFGDGGKGLEDSYELGEAAMKRGDYVGAMEHFQRVLEAQPKPPPIFAKAADRHRTADRMARQKKVPTGVEEPKGDAGATSKPPEAGRPAPASKSNKPKSPKTAVPLPKSDPVPGRTNEPTIPPSREPKPEDFIPPEFRQK